MNSAIRSVASVMTGALAVLLGSVAASAQATVDTENSYPNVGAIMVWRVDAKSVGLHELSDHIAAAAPFRMRWMLGGAKNSGIGTVPTTAPMKRSVSG
jgi:hypothetical protein